MSEIATSLLEAVHKLLKIKNKIDLVGSTLDPKSLSTITKNTTIEPFCVISRDCANLDYMPEINSTLLNMFIAYYLQAFNNLLKLNNVRIRKLLNATGTNTSIILEAHASTNDSILNFKLPNSSNLSLENKLVGYTTGSGKDQPDIESYSNLAVGKLIEITFNLDGRYESRFKTRETKNTEYSKSETTEKSETRHGDKYERSSNGNDKITTQDPSPGSKEANTIGGKEGTGQTKEEQLFYHEGQEFTILVLVKLLVNVVPTSTIEGLLVRFKEDISFSERWMSWRAGRIKFWRDLVLCQDLINESKRNAIKDDAGVTSAIDNRVRDAVEKKLATVAYKSLEEKTSEYSNLDSYSFGVASNLYVITAAEAAKIEYALRGKLSSQSVRNKLFGNGYAMILAVVDPDRERVKFYVQGVEGYSDLSIREIKSAAKNKGPDITDMLKMMQMGMAPTF